MNSVRASRLLPAYLVAVLIATVWGSVVQTLFNLSALLGIGAELPALQWPLLVLRDIFSGFTPTYAGFIVAPALLVAFLAAGAVARATRSVGPARAAWYAMAGGLALLLGIPLVNYLAPVALLIGASRDWSCTLLMALGGALAGYLFARWVPAAERAPEAERAPAEAGVQPVRKF